MAKPELLLPAGSPEAFHAALEGGADAVYLGFSRFNARQRAKNFNLPQLAGLLDIAAKKNVRVYITLNTLIKNDELGELLDQLHLIASSGAAAAIIQDWGVWQLARRHFPQLVLHASTQLGIHNSAGAAHLRSLGFSRAVLARELTLEEIRTVKGEGGLEVEVFVHGALCYSISGHCLFSSFLGGMSANRGLCRQPCRRIYRGGSADGYLFSLNDLELLAHVPELAAAGVDSFKIEGRMKSAEYVYSAARAYRMVLDDPGKMEDAQALLAGDLGRQKTPYFAGGDVSAALTGSAFTGRLLGKIEKTRPDGFTFTPAFAFTRRARLRILGKGGRDTEQLKILSLHADGTETDAVPAGTQVTVTTGKHEGRSGDEVYLSMAGEKKFPDKIAPGKFSFTMKLPEAKKAAILRELAPPAPPRDRELLLRVDTLAWLPKIFFQRMDTLILALTLEEAETLDLARPFLQKNLAKIALQLPLFIPEGQQAAWRSLCRKLAAAGLTRFVLSQPGQMRLVPDDKGVTLLAGEDAYRLNDAAAVALRAQGFATGILPLENDLANLEATRDRTGIVPLYFRPPLFRSRMPVAAGDAPLRDQHAAYLLHQREGLTIVTPDRPVCLFQHRARLESLGYRRFLIDLSFEKPSQNTFNRLLGNYDAGQPEKQALLFNFKGGLQ